MTLLLIKVFILKKVLYVGPQVFLGASAGVSFTQSGDWLTIGLGISGGAGFELSDIERKNSCWCHRFSIPKYNSN